MVGVAEAHWNGLGTPVDKTKAKKWYEEAYKKGQLDEEQVKECVADGSLPPSVLAPRLPDGKNKHACAHCGKADCKLKCSVCLSVCYCDAAW